ncbi:hypothetical protein [Blastococcus sp. SYSU D00695]
MSRARSFPIAVAVLATVGLAGCVSSVEGRVQAVGGGADESVIADPPYAFGPLDELTETASAADVAGPDAEIFDVGVADGGRAVLLLAADDGPLQVARDAPGGWRSNDLPGLGEIDGGDSQLAVADDGTAVVVTRERDVLVVSAVSPAGDVDTAEVADALLAEREVLTWGLSRDGATLVAAVGTGAGDAWTLLAVDVPSGEVTARQELPFPGAPGASVAHVAVGREQVVLVADVETEPSGTAQTSVLRRFTPDLEPVDEVALSAGTSNVGPLTLDDGGTAYVALVEGGVQAPEPTLQVLEVRLTATEPLVAASFPGLDYVRSLDVDPIGRYGYLGGLTNGATGTALTVTAVDLGGGGDEPRVVPVCDDGLFRDAAIDTGAGGLVAIGECARPGGGAEWQAWSIR